MKFHKIEMIGDFFMPSVPTLPVWTVDDVHRLIFVEDEDNVYYGATVEYGDWIEMGKIFVDKGNSLDPLTGEGFAGRRYHMQIVDGNIKYTYED